MQLLVMGMHRSGTSVTARLLNMMGAYFGPEGCALPADASNPKGFWERRDVMALNKALMQLQDAQWHTLSGWSFDKAAKVPDDLRHSMHTHLLNIDAHRPWFMKDPRFCLTLPAWRPMLESPLAIIVHRDPVEIALSLQARSSFPLPYALAMWEYHVVGLLNATQDMPRIFVRHAELAEKPVKICRGLHAQLTELGVRHLEMPSGPEIRAFIDPSLHRAKAASASLRLSSAHIALSEMMQGLYAPEKPLTVSKASQTIVDAGVPVTG